MDESIVISKRRIYTKPFDCRRSGKCRNILKYLNSTSNIPSTFNLIKLNENINDISLTKSMNKSTHNNIKSSESEEPSKDSGIISTNTTIGQSSEKKGIDNISLVSAFKDSGINKTSTESVLTDDIPNSNISSSEEFPSINFSQNTPPKPVLTFSAFSDSSEAIGTPSEKLRKVSKRGTIEKETFDHIIEITKRSDTESKGHSDNNKKIQKISSDENKKESKNKEKSKMKNEKENSKQESKKYENKTTSAEIKIKSKATQNDKPNDLINSATNTLDIKDKETNKNSMESKATQKNNLLTSLDSDNSKLDSSKKDKKTKKNLTESKATQKENSDSSKLDAKKNDKKTKLKTVKKDKVSVSSNSTTSKSEVNEKTKKSKKLDLTKAKNFKTNKKSVSESSLSSTSEKQKKSSKSKKSSSNDSIVKSDDKFKNKKIKDSTAKVEETKVEEISLQIPKKDNVISNVFDYNRDSIYKNLKVMNFNERDSLRNMNTRLHCKMCDSLFHTCCNCGSLMDGDLFPIISKKMSRPFGKRNGLNYGMKKYRTVTICKPKRSWKCKNVSPPSSSCSDTLSLSYQCLIGDNFRQHSNNKRIVCID